MVIYYIWLAGAIAGVVMVNLPKRFSMRSIKLIRGGRFRPHGKASNSVKPFGDQITHPHPPLEFPFCPYMEDRQNT